MLRVLTPPLRNLFTYSVKIDGENICIRASGVVNSDAATEIVFSGKAQPGVTATDVNVEEVKKKYLLSTNGRKIKSALTIFFPCMHICI